MKAFINVMINKKSIRSAVSAIIILLVTYSSYGQGVQITGTASVQRGNSYSYSATYNGSGTYSYSGTYSWTITGGYITGTANTTSKSGSTSGPLLFVSLNVTWTTPSSSASLALTLTIGNATKTITVYAPLSTGTISPTSTNINYGANVVFTGTAATGGATSPVYNYQWQKSMDAVNWTDISGATSLNYTSDTLQTARYFRRKVTETTTSTIAYTSTATVNVYPKLTGSISSSQRINYNTIPDTLRSVAGGGNGTYSYQWQSSLNNSSWSNVSTSSKYRPGALTATTYYRLTITSNGANVTSNTDTVTVYPQLTCSINASQNINYNSVASPLTSSVSGGNSIYSYQWQNSPDNSTWTTIGSGNSFNPGMLTATTYYRLTATSNGVSVTSSTVTVTVYPQLTTSISPATQTIVSGTAPATMSPGASGGNSTYTYQWQSSPDNITWTNRATTSTYNPGTLTSNFFYRVIVSSNGVTTTSNPVAINTTFSASLTITSTTPGGDGSVSLLTCTASGGSGSFSYAWYTSVDAGSSYQVIPGASGSTYTTDVISTNTLYYAVVTSGGNTANTNTVNITMPYAPSITSNATIACDGASVTFTASGGSGSYKWYNASGTQLGTGSTYSASVSGAYYAVSYSGSGVSPHSNTINITAAALPSSYSILGSSVCVLGSSAQLANVVSGGTWSSDNASIAKIGSDGVVSGKAAGAATISYTATNVCGTGSALLGITVVPFNDIAQTLGIGINDPLITDTVSLAASAVKETIFRQDTAYSTAHSIKNVLALKIIEETNKYIPGDFSATAVLKVEYGHSPTDIYQLDSIKLSVNYTKNEGAKYNALNYFAFNNAEYTRITVLRIEAPTTVGGTSFGSKQVLLLTNSLAGSRFYKMADNKKPVLSYTAPNSSPVPDELPVSWILPAHTQHNGVQLEWTWLEDEMKGSYTVGGAFDTALLFKSSATRIDLPGGSTAGGYKIPLLYDGVGTLYMRARGVNTMPSGSRSDGPWSAVNTYAFSGHSDSLNWQVNTTFAEEGKRKTVIQYYDGSLRQRQTVTKDNTTHQTIVAETFYDGQGRPAVQILPAPGINNIIAYTANLNKFNTQVDNTDPADYFDFTTPSLGNYATPALDSISGASEYYSKQNTDSYTGYHKNIPSANGYAYSVTRYTPDATGRILRQSGAGDSLSMSSGHETKYFYGTPAQEELDALFGTEAGNYTHYFKNMVQDANGQMSVGYTDMHGRTVATALAGEAPAAMQALNISDTAQYKNQAGKLLTRNLLDKNSNILKSNSSESINSILVPFKTNHTFNYRLNKKTFAIPKCGGGTINTTCKFDLQISITDESGDTAPVVYNYTNIDSVNFSQTLLLDAGSYSIRKTLSINQTTFNSTLRLLTTTAVGTCKTQQQLIDSIYAADSAGCSIVAAPLTNTGCMASLGSYATYLSNYADSLGKTIGQLSTATLNDIRNQYIADSSFCTSLNTNASSSLATIRKKMLSDMVPYGGQYADTGSGTMYTKYNIFVTNGAGTPFYKYPLTPLSATGNYYDPFGNIDTTVLAARLLTMSNADFENQFKDSWTTSLLPYHPEYAKLKFAEDSLRASFNFIDSVQLVTAPFSLVTYDPYFAIPNRTTEKDSITRYSNVAWKDMNNYSMWQLAYADAFGCKTIGDPDARNTCYINMPKVQTATGTSVNTGSGSVTLSAAIQTQAWTMYKGLYRQVRDEMVNRFINIRPNKVDTADNQKLIDQGFRIYFPYSYVQSARNNDWESWYPKAGPGGSTGTINMSDSAAKSANHCDSYINAWRLALQDCPALAAKDSATREGILRSITGKMAEVCSYGTDGANPYGASTVPPGYSWLNYTSFEQAVYAVLDSAGIDSSLVCNPYGIEWPKPYGKSPKVSKQYVAAIDDCTCSQWFYLSNEIALAGYDKYSFTSVNQYLRNRYQDTLTVALFNGLSNCSNGYYYNCRDTIRTYDHHGMPFTDTVKVCDTVYSYPLQSPQPLPVFLTCGFDSSNLRCYSCSDFINLENTFYGLFGKHPVFSGAVSDSAILWNDLFARYVNFKTGLNKPWTYYSERFNTYGCAIGGVTGTGTGLAICPETKAMNDTTGFVQYAPTPCQLARNRATERAAILYDYNQQQLIADFTNGYIKACGSTTELFTVADTIKEYHYTLYYYDQGGNLVKTVPPKGVRPDYSAPFLTAVATERAKMLNAQSWTATVPQHNLITRYNYNSLNQVVLQKSPDGGVSKFWYDRLGRLAVSQNAKQRTQTNVYSYTSYDSLGRITEVGQLTNATAITDAIAKNTSSLQSWFTGVSNSREQITQTIYDTAYGPINGVTLSQKNLRNRVSYTQLINAAANGFPASATYYTYDIHGNVDTLLQDYGNSSGIANAMNQSGNRFKKIVYNYDLVSGKVNQVSYQPGEADAYYHRYEYDTENRLTDVYSGRDSVLLTFFPEREAHYNYYKHGPLAQTILGQLQVQKQDYAYTLQGWLKGINPTMGGTLTNGTDTTEAFPIAQDVYGFSLHYFKNDYKAIGYTPQGTSVLGALGTDAAPLFNGNIAGMVVNIPKLGETKTYNYHYDQLNRIVAMDMFTGLNVNSGTFTPISVNDYRERISYDPNGNILTYDRHGDAARLAMDSLKYFYTTNTNRLHKVTDAATDAAPVDYNKYNDIKQGQADDNYQYDDIGNLVADNAESITNVTWNVYGKIASITKSGSLIKYVYDAAGNRIMKQTSTDTTIYARDAGGNVLSVYSKPVSGTLVQSELHLYGSSRLGMTTQHMVQDTSVVLSGGFINAIRRIFIRGEKVFELSNHLGNVLVTLSDKKISVDQNTNGAIDYYTADISSANDYYAFGMQMPIRKFSTKVYKYGFNGKENDNEVKGDGNQQDYGMRVYDPRLAKFLSVDPLSNKYPYLTPYQFAGNSPIKFVDLDGLEPANPDQNEYKGKTWAIDKVYQKTGGDEKYSEKHDLNLGNYVQKIDQGKFFANDNGNNNVVNQSSQFEINEGAFSDEKDLVNHLLGDFIWGNGPENIVFPENGKFATNLKSSIIVGETLTKWAKDDYADGVYKWGMDLRGEVNVDVNSGLTSLEHFLGSAATKISKLDDGQIKVEIFNVTSFSSGYLTKDIPVINWFVDKPQSTRRMDGNGRGLTYSNTSQYFSFTMSTSEADKLINKFSGGTVSKKE